MPTLASARSFLFAPGSDERKLTKALSIEADGVIADLEDAVSLAEKTSARELALRVMADAKSESLRMIRLNGFGSPFFDQDLEAISTVDFLDAIVLPKATPEAVDALGRDGPPVVAIIETAIGLRQAFETASATRVEALVLGAVDLGLELDLERRDDGQELLFARSKLVLDSAAAGLRGPIDSAYVDFRDDEGLEADCHLARSLGFRGKPCIHPAQLAIVNRVFTPSTAELERAAQVVAVYEEAEAAGKGAVQLDGEMIDLPIVERARRLLETRERSVAHGN